MIQYDQGRPDFPFIIRVAALLFGIAIAISVIATPPFAMVSIYYLMDCMSGHCSIVRIWALIMGVMSPVILIISVGAGFISYRAPGIGLLILTFCLPPIVLAAYLILPEMAAAHP
ncbi:hypothetical protein [Novosphingobium kaempferiae]|uniref:hypothetical protein n=1 Tax=Novosphingobium kaempferiae TaxID=2896849 RepID=UPI001E2CAD1D|nr:hypothetical protein [Novosphingobium kaempferiae]